MIQYLVLLLILLSIAGVIGTMTLKLSGAAPGALTRKEWALIRKAAYVGVAEYWHRVLRKKHFTKSAESEYGYARRQQEYTATKMRRFGHARPLVYTGRSMRRTAARKISGSGKRSRVIMKAGNIGLDAVGGFLGETIDTADELTAISAEDRRLISLHMGDFVQRAIRDFRGAKEIKI